MELSSSDAGHEEKLNTGITGFDELIVSVSRGDRRS